MQVSLSVCVFVVEEWVERLLGQLAASGSSVPLWVSGLAQIRCTATAGAWVPTNSELTHAQQHTCTQQEDTHDLMGCKT